MMKIVFGLVAGLAATIATGAAAQTLTFDPGAPAPASGYTVINDFNDAGDLAALSGSGFSQHAPGSDSTGAQPANSVPGGTPYLTVVGGGLADYDLSAFNPRRIQFDWGSIDDYNTLTIRTALGGVYNIVPGSSTFPNAADGNQFAPGTNGRFTFKVGNDRISSVSFASRTNSFEIDNFSIAGGVPEPATWALMIMGFGAVGATLRRRSAARVAMA